jgi:PleD family two-component response regulator
MQRQAQARHYDAAFPAAEHSIIEVDGVGVAQWRVGETIDHLLERTDAALYRAKRAGRNRVEVDTGEA